MEDLGDALLVRSSSSEEESKVILLYLLMLSGRIDDFMFSSDGNDDGVDAYDEDDDVACNIAISVALARCALQTV